MGQQNSNLSKLCCNNNLCNYENNIENLTEVNRRGYDDQSSVGGRSRQNGAAGGGAGNKGAKNGSLLSEQKYDDIDSNVDILTDSKKRQLIKNAFDFQDEELKNRLISIASEAPKIQLQVVSSATLQKGMIIEISATGLSSHPSKRQVIDGYTYFGRKSSIKKGPHDPNAETTTLPKQIVNDFVIPSKNQQTAEQQRGRHFQIRFDERNFAYYIKDLGIGHGVFVKQREPIILKDNMIINVGEAHIVVNLLREQPDDYDSMATQSDNSRLKLKIFGGPSSGEIFYFKNEGQEIIIGRTPNCDIRIDDKLLSKTQAHIRCLEQGGPWVLTDGYNGKASTNGTWLYLNEDFQIYDTMIFKANQTIFEVRIITKDQEQQQQLQAQSEIYNQEEEQEEDYGYQ